MYSEQKWNETLFPLPRTVYNQIYTSAKPTAVRRFKKAIGRNRCFNEFTKFDKWKTYRILAKSDLNAYLPSTFYLKRSQLIPLLNKYGSLFIKDARGSLGKNIYKIKRIDGKIILYQDNNFPKDTFENDKALLRKIKKLMREKSFIVQAEIELPDIDGRLFDFRIMVQKNGIGKWDITTGAARVAYKNYFVTNVYRSVESMDQMLNQAASFSTHINPIQLKEKIYEICLQIAAVLERKQGHLGDIGIDIAVDKFGRIWIIEVNGNPSKTIFEDYGDEEEIKSIYRKPMEYASYLSTGRRAKK